MEICEPYATFCRYYDNVLMHVNFPRWKNFILKEYLTQKKKNPSRIVDLGCGTGSLLGEFRDIRASKIGIDISEDMLEVARTIHKNIQFIQGDLQNFQLNEKADLIFCTHDSLNYLRNLKSIEKHFKCVIKNLSREGLYFFDITSEHNLMENFHGKTIEENIPEGRLIWRNEYIQGKRKIISELEFITKGKSIKEIHIQKYYPPDEILQILNKLGFTVIKMGSDYKNWKPSESASLINFLVKLS